MIIYLSNDLERFVHEAVRAGRYATEDEVVRDALERLQKLTPTLSSSARLIGAMRDAGEDDAEGLDGDAFGLLGAFQENARRQGWDQDEIAAVIAEAMLGDDGHLMSTLSRHVEPPPSGDEAASTHRFTKDELDEIYAEAEAETWLGLRRKAANDV